MTKQNPLIALATPKGETRYYELAATTAGGLAIDDDSFHGICKLHLQAIRSAGSPVIRAHEWVRYADFLLERRSDSAPETLTLRRKAALALEEAAKCYREAGKLYAPSARAYEQRANELLAERTKKAAPESGAAFFVRSGRRHPATKFLFLFYLCPMKRPDATLAAYIEAEIIPRYEGFDAAHRTDHVRTVITQSLELAAHYDVDPDMVYTVAAFHDTGLANGRERHHIDAGLILEADAELRRWFTEEQIAVMRDAVEDHRASSPRTPHRLRPHRGRSRPGDRPRNHHSPHRAVRAGALPGAGPRGAIRTVSEPPTGKIRRGRLPAASDRRIGERPATPGAARGDPGSATAADAL